MQEEFPRPEAVHPNARFVEENIYSSAPVRRMALQEIPRILESEETETKHFYIKRLQMPNSELMLNIPEYFTSAVLYFLRIRERLERKGEADVETKMVEFFSQKDKIADLKLTEGETVQIKIAALFDMLKLENVVRHYKLLYERHRDWYNTQIPDCVVDKLYFLSHDSKNETHGYVLKPRIENDADITYSLLAIFDEARLSRGDTDRLKQAGADLADSLKRTFSPDQLLTLSNEIEKFITITQRVISDEKIVIDPAGFQSLNILISTEGHIQMINPDRVYPAIERGAPSQAATNVGYELTALKYAAEYIKE